MLLAIDIGNTTTRFGWFERDRLRAHWVIATPHAPTSLGLTRRLKALNRRHWRRIGRASEIIVCSVVPRMSAALRGAFRALGSGPIRLVGREVRVPLRNRYRRPSQVGQDRLVGAFAALETYHRDTIVVDFGTAITIDIVSRNAEYLGGVIAPGPHIALDALADRTALLPEVSLAKPGRLLGRDTIHSIRSGVVYGSAALCDGLVRQLKRQYAPGATVVATGGAGRLIVPHCRTIRHFNEHLVLDGLNLLSRRFLKQ